MADGVDARPRLGVAAPLATVVFLVGELAVAWFGWAADEDDAAFRITFRWSPVVGAVLALVLLVAVARRSAAPARGAGYAQFVRIVVVVAALFVVGAGGASSGSYVLADAWVTASLALSEAFLAFGVARRLSPGRPGTR